MIPKTDFPPVDADGVSRLEAQGCRAADWSRVRISPDTDLTLIQGCRFYGDVNIGTLRTDDDNPQGLYDAVIRDCSFGNNVYISGVTGHLRGLTVGDNAYIENAGVIEAEPGAQFGAGTEVAVLDETGSRPVVIFPGLTAQLAVLMARRPRWAERHLRPMLEEALTISDKPVIGAGARITGVRLMRNVRVDRGVCVDYASRLVDGDIISNAPGNAAAYVGADVDAEHFIIEDGRVDSGTLLRNCYVGQGASLDKRFCAHDSLFFANCACECGEACAIIAGPYTVSMHKSSLLIGGQYSFFNAGSGTNSSNHKYKLGPVHWGVMDRGVKTSSDSYIMWGGHIGAFSLLMGSHKQHPDTSALPFSYLFGTQEGHTVACPGLMLSSCGLMRDELKWPKRDARIKARLPLHDNITFDVFNPLTVQAMMRAVTLLAELKNTSVSSQGYHTYQGIRITPKACDRAIKYYCLAIAKYICGHRTAEGKDDTSISVTSQNPADYEWRDVGGQLMPLDVIDNLCQAESPAALKEGLDRAFAEYRAMERAWIKAAVTPALLEKLGDLDKAAARLDKLTTQDRETYLETLGRHNTGLEL